MNMYAPKPDQDLIHSPSAPLYPAVNQFPPQISTGYPFPPQHPAEIQYVRPPPQQVYQPFHPQQRGPPPPPPPPPTTEWSSGLCDCCKDPSNCCLTCWCPCITFGLIAEIVDQGSPACAVSGGIYGLLLYFTGCACCYSCFYRTKMRAKFNLGERPCGDCLLHCCCDPCALCQEYRELKHKGYDPALGWMGNLQKQQQQQGVGIAMSAPVPQTMSKP